MNGWRHVVQGSRLATITVGLCALMLAAPAARGDVTDTILDLVLQSVDPDLFNAKQLLKCAIGQGALNDKTLQVCGGALAKAKADGYLASHSTAQTVVTVGIAASKKQWGKVIEIGGSELVVQLACTAAMPPGPVKAVLCSSISSELAKLAKPVLSGVVAAVSSSPPDVLRLVSILGPGLACKVDVIPAAMREIACGALGEILAAGKELAEGLAELAGLAVEAAGYVFDAGDKVLGSYHEKQTPKAYFKAYWANATHLGAWLKYVKGDAALTAFVNDKHSSCNEYFGSAKPCHAMRKVFLDTVNPVAAQLDGAAAAYFELNLRTNLLYHYLFYKSSGGKYPGFNWGGNACHLMEKFPLLEGDGLQATQPRPTVWDHACKKAQDLLLAELAQKKQALEMQLALLAKQGCTATSSSNLYCVNYDARASCLAALPTHASQCVVDAAKANAALAPQIAQQLGKRCKPAQTASTVQCTRPWKVDRCKSLVAGMQAQKGAPWFGTLAIACTPLSDPSFESAKLDALQIAGQLNVKAGTPPTLMVSAAMDSGAACQPGSPDPVAIRCAGKQALKTQLGLMPNLGVDYCPSDPNGDGADAPCLENFLMADDASQGVALHPGEMAAAPPAAVHPRPEVTPPVPAGRLKLVQPGEPDPAPEPSTAFTTAGRAAMPAQAGPQAAAGGEFGRPRSALPAAQAPVSAVRSLPGPQPQPSPSVQSAPSVARAPVPAATPNWGSTSRQAVAVTPPAPAASAPAPRANTALVARAITPARELAALSCTAAPGEGRFTCATRTGFDRCEALRRERKVERCTLVERR